MKKLGFDHLYRLIRKYNRSDIKGVSEAIGTVLLLGISVTLAGGVALWTAQIDEGEEGLYVDIWADVRGTDLVLMHKGGDLLSGASTTIKITNDDGSVAFEATYLDLTGDDRWDPGEDLNIDLDDPAGDGSLPAVTDIFNIIVITPLPGGAMTVILNNRLFRSTTASGLPDLAITQVLLSDLSGFPIVMMNNEGSYNISVRVDNFGSDMTSQFFSQGSGYTVENLRLFDSEEEIVPSNLSMSHFDASSNTTLSDSDAGFGIMESGDHFIANFTWYRSSADPRTLGSHTLNVKVVPANDGEINYRNNYVERSYTVDKLVVPIPIFGPDPGIYDISFSNDAPSSGEEITVTVIVQNSGDQPFNSSHGVNMIVSTWKPEVHASIDNFVSSVSYDWRVDYPGHYGDWRSESPDVALSDDNIFPTCVKTDIELLPGAYFFYYFTLEARVEVPGGEQWVYAAIDVYESPGHLEGIAIEEGDDTSGLDNFDLANIQVLPKIMLVDDDDANTGSSGDMTSSVLESLVGSGVSVDKIYITQQIEDNFTMRDAPAYTYEQEEIPAPAMEDYDIIIWVTGFVTDPFTNDPRATEDEPGGNIQELMDYMDSRRYLMIIGASPLEGLNTNFNAGNTQVYSGGTSADEFADANAFVFNYLGISYLETNIDLPTADPLSLIGTDISVDGLTPPPDGGGDYELDILEQAPGNALSQFYTPRDVYIDEATGLDFEIAQGMLTRDSELDPSTGKENVVRTWSTPIGEYGSQYRACIMGFDITQIQYLNEKINLFASVLRWFDWEINVGRDLAVTKMELSIITEVDEGGTTSWDTVPLGVDNLPKYLDTIEIEVTIRNNGPISESTSVMFYATGPDNIELPITTGIPDPRTNSSETNTNPQDLTGIQSQGGEEIIYKLWLAVGVGIYTFRVVVDPYHLISEISEENNDISYSTSTITSFVTQNNILVVDDDMSLDNFAGDVDTQAQIGDLLIDYSGSGGEPSEIIDLSLDLLGYDHETHVVENVYDLGDGSWELDASLGILDLKRYNSIIWVLGDSGMDLIGQPETTTIKDMQALKKYLDGDYPEADYLAFDHNENVMFIGQNMVVDILDIKDDIIVDSSLYTVGEMMDNYYGLAPLGATSGGFEQMMIGTTTGDFINDVYVGIEYSNPDFDTTFEYNSLPVPDTLESENDTTRPGLFSYDGAGNYELVATQYEKTNAGNETYFRTLIHSWQMRASKHDSIETSMNEVLFLALHWFDTPELKPELLSRNSKINFDNDNPVLGNSYLVSVEIANLGGVAGGGTVRFMDGNTLIKSESIFINPDQTTTLEAIWTPLYAGERQMTIWIDKYDNYDEVFDDINNNPKQTREIYFFWDDMESGEGNWRHDTTNILINGEGKLDYMGEPTYVNIDSSWNGSNGFGKNTAYGNPNLLTEFHSSPYSYTMFEPSGSSQKASDIVFDIDSSGSMGRSYDNNDPDNIRKSAARNFIDNMYNEDRVAIYDFDSSVTLRQKLTFDKTSAKSAIGHIDSSGSTALYESGAEAIDYLGKYGRSESEAVKAVIILTDGQDTASSINLNTYLNTKNQYDNDPATEELIYVFTIRFVDGDANILRQMCTQPWDEGPFYFEANDPNDLGDIYETIGDIIEGISQSSTRSEPETPTRATIFEDDFPTNVFDGSKWDSSGSSILVTKDPQSGSYCVELDRTDAPETVKIDLSGQSAAYLEFYWRGGYQGAGQGMLESNDYFYLDIHTSAGWILDFYVVNNNCFYTPWTHETVVLPRDALWNEFKVRFRSRLSGSSYTSDGYYVDNIKVESGSIGKGSLGGEFSNFWSDGTITSNNKYIETNPVDLTYVNSGNLSFYHKYNLERGSNGGVLMIGTSATESGPYQYRYIQPDQPYTGNILMTEWANNLDDFNNEIKWCWNGISSGGTLDWEYVTVNLDDFTMDGIYEANFVKVRFYYIYAYGGTGYGWIIDDVKLSTTSASENTDKYDTLDHWKLKEAPPGMEGNFSHSGSNAWFCGDDSKMGLDQGDFLSGIDNSLYTRPIDLTNAKSAHLSAYFKFNFDNSPGRPPDGFRVEVSRDNGISWIPLSLGVRSSWGVSGTELDADDGVIGDGRSYTGLYNDHYWVSADSLSRLITDMSGFIGNVVILRFRVITNTDALHYDDVDQFKGFYVDDVIIYGESLEESRSEDTTDRDQMLILEDPLTLTDYKEIPETTISGDVSPDTSTNDITYGDDESPMMNNDHEDDYRSPEWLLFMILPLMIVLSPIVLRKRYP